MRDDVVRMANDWQQAKIVRAYLASVAENVREVERTADFAAWFAWATTYAETLDPLNAPERIAKRLDPDADGDARV
jgi:hypothetical protein